MPDIPPVIDPPAIIVTASRAPEQTEDTGASVSVIEEPRIHRLGEPLAVSFLRLLPSTSVSASGPAGSLTQVRIRGAEANHTLLFIDGIRANDPAAGNEPRFELLNADIASRIEVVRGPQSALWGSEAIGGVVAVEGSTPAGSGGGASVEAGTNDFRRASATAHATHGDLAFALAGGLQRSDGIDSFDGGGDRDGYSNLALRGRASWAASPSVELGLSGFAFRGRSDFDGFDPFTFLRADTLDRSRNRLAAGRLWGKFEQKDGPWSGRVSASLLGSRNRNLLAGTEVNETEGRRAVFEAQVEHRLTTGSLDHLFIVAAEHESEKFTARDQAFGGFTNQDRSRRHDSLVGEWRGTLAERVIADVAVRHDRFNRFRDATTVRASLLGKITPSLSLAASYGEGIAQPTFFDLFGFFPGSFVGNPSLQPESSKGFEVSVRLEKRHWSGALTYFRQTLKDEIVGTFDHITFLSSAENADGKSRRSGLEAELKWLPAAWLRLTANYSYLQATEPSLASGQLREVRRPKHSGSVAADGSRGRLNYGASIAYIGKRIDTDFDQFPAARVRLDPYWLAGARLSYALHRSVDLFARVSNAFDEDYQDVVGYRTEGRSAYAGLRLAFGR